MAGRVFVKIDKASLKKIQSRLNAMSKRGTSACQTGIMDVAKVAYDKAMLAAPIGETNELKNSFDIAHPEIHGKLIRTYLYNLAPHAIWVEYGTGLYGEGPDAKGDVVKPIHGLYMGPIPPHKGTVYPEYLEYHKGQLPQPFMRPILWDESIHSNMFAVFQKGAKKVLFVPF